MVSIFEEVENILGLKIQIFQDDQCLCFEGWREKCWGERGLKRWAGPRSIMDDERG